MSGYWLKGCSLACASLLQDSVWGLGAGYGRERVLYNPTHTWFPRKLVRVIRFWGVYIYTCMYTCLFMETTIRQCRVSTEL